VVVSASVRPPVPSIVPLHNQLRTPGISRRSPCRPHPPSLCTVHPARGGPAAVAARCCPGAEVVSGAGSGRRARRECHGHVCPARAARPARRAGLPAARCRAGGLPLAPGRDATGGGRVRPAGRAVAARPARCHPRGQLRRAGVRGRRRSRALRGKGRWRRRGEHRPPGRVADHVRAGHRARARRAAGGGRHHGREGGPGTGGVPGRRTGVPALGTAARRAVPRPAAPARCRPGASAPGRDRLS